MAQGAAEGLGHDGVTPKSEFRTTISSREGLGPTHIFQGRVINIDMVNWTVDVYSQFDQMRFLDVPIASPYLHPNRGDGFSVMPEVGSKVVICYPGDSSPPFVLAFVMPHEPVPLTGAEDAPKGTGDRSNPAQTSSNASFAGGRPKPKPGDMRWQGRDGQFVVLHRGGVLQIGSNELSQRIYVPLNNLIMDFAENYRLHSAGGSVSWGLQEGNGTDNLPTQFAQTFRVFANDELADVRVAIGKVHQPTPEKDVEPTLTIQDLELGTEEPIVFELALSREGFKAEDGSLTKVTQANSKLRLFFDREGGTFFRTEGNVGINMNKRLKLRVKEDIELFGEKDLRIVVDNDVRLEAGGILELRGEVTKINGGDTPVAKAGDTVAVQLPAELVVAAFAPATPPPTAFGAVGTITGGSATVLVPGA
jgi:hypothetical protein